MNNQPDDVPISSNPASSTPSPNTHVGSGSSRRAFLTGSGALAATAVGSQLFTSSAHAVGGAAAAAGAGSAAEWPPGPGRILRPQRADRELREILAAIDPHRIEAIVRKLASFGTRHTLSEPDRP